MNGPRIVFDHTRSICVLFLGAVLLTGGCSQSAQTESAPTQNKMSPPGHQEDGYFSTRVFYATDRASETVEGKTEFTGRRGDGELAYGIVEVSIPDTHKMGEIEAPSWWKRWDRENPTKYVLVLSIDPLTGRTEFASKIESVLAEAGRDDVLVFVHGYNVEFDEAAKRTAQMAYDLKFSGAPIFYSWPSRGGFSDYPADEASVQWTVPHFKEFLRFVLTGLGAKNVHLIAHSMGNRAVVTALNALDTSTLPEGSARLRQIVLAAPDIDAGVFKQLAKEFPGKAARITLYTSSTDKAIIASRKLHKEPRAGGSIVVVDGIDTIDASRVHSDFLNHSSFGSSFLPDIFGLIHNDLPPNKRAGLRKEGRYWFIVPGRN